MTVQEAARVLEVSPDLVYRLCAAGKLGHTRVGLGRGAIRIDAEDIAALKGSRRVEPREEPVQSRKPLRRPGPSGRPDGKPLRDRWQKLS